MSKLIFLGLLQLLHCSKGERSIAAKKSEFGFRRIEIFLIELLGEISFKKILKEIRREFATNPPFAEGRLPLASCSGPQALFPPLDLLPCYL